MDIPSLSVALSQVNIADQVSVALLSKTLDTAEQTNAKMIQMMEQSVQPNLGQTIDIRI